jgi:Molecular chaperone, HSP90 family
MILIDKLPQTEIIKDKGYEILYLIDEVDEFALKVMRDYKGKEFKSISSEDLGIEEEKIEEEKETESKEIFEKMKELLQGKVSKVRFSKRLKNHPVCLASEGEISIEMEKVLKQMPEGDMIKAEKYLK